MAEKSETITLKKDTVWKVVSGILLIVVIVMFINSKGGNIAPSPSQPSAGTQDKFQAVAVDMNKIAADDP